MELVEALNPPTASLQAIYIADLRGGPMRQLKQVNLIAGRGLEGDRYFDGRGSFSRWPGGGRAVSIIAGEAIDAIASEQGFDLSNGRHRRNLVTQGVDLNALVGRWFTIGDATLFGNRACAPCRYLERLIAPGLYEAIKGRGGLRADVLRDGVLRTGDPIVVLPKRPSLAMKL